MNWNRLFKGSIFSVVGGMILFQACTHDPTIIDPGSGPDPDPVDTGSTGIDTMVNNSNPCDPDSIYFENDILPIFISNCALSGCHNAATATEGIILDSYQNIMSTGEVVPFNLDDNDIYEVITEDDIDKRMPPPPRTALKADQINKIARWILQGAKNIDCEEHAGGCETENISFSGFVAPVLADNCQGCHSGAAPSGGISLVGFDNIRSVALSGQLHGVIEWLPSYPPMPQGGPKLDDCTIDKIKSWIDDGAPNN